MQFPPNYIRSLSIACRFVLRLAVAISLLAAAKTLTETIGYQFVSPGIRKMLQNKAYEPVTKAPERERGLLSTATPSTATPSTATTSTAPSSDCLCLLLGCLSSD